MSKSTFKINFLIRKGGSSYKGENPIYVRLTINTERIEFNSKLTIKTENWSSEAGCATGSSAKKINAHLDLIRIKLYESMKELSERGLTVSAENIRNHYLGVLKETSYSILTLYKEHNEKLFALVNKGYAFSTLEKHLTTYKHLQSFISQQYAKDDLPIEAIDIKFLSDFEFYLRTSKNIGNNTTVKYLKNTGKILREAYNAGYIKRNPFALLRLRTEEIDRPFLEMHEIQKISKKRFDVKRLEQIRDIFLFCCFTGLAFIDAKHLSEDCIITAPNGQLWIKKQREKTKKWSHIPILPEAKYILDKYEQHPIRKEGYLLPFPTNQKMNAYLKEIAEICKIKKNLTTHCARHTFATTITLANKVSMESVSKMLGHSSIVMTKTYARILDSTIEKEMSQLKFEISDK
ncbi:MAG: site-specific integrase [Bacteroidales bacterium]